MNDRQYRAVYNGIYRLFDDVTPLRADCGMLCGKACCKGDENTGMLLFPHEETAFKTIKSQSGSLCVCNGVCERNDRPLSCRIFPLFPALDKNGNIKVIPDLRGADICPLVRQAENVSFDRRFLRHVRVTGKILSRDAECREFLRKVTEQIEEISEIQNKFLK